MPHKTSATRPKWIFLAVTGVSVFLILISPNWQSADPEAQLGLLLFGPVIAILFACTSLVFFDFITQKDMRRNFISQFSKRPFGSAINIIQVALIMGFLGLIFLSGISFGPEKSNLFIFLPIAFIAVEVLKSKLRK